MRIPSLGFQMYFMKEKEIVIFRKRNWQKRVFVTSYISKKLYYEFKHCGIKGLM